ncbi:phage portal protein [Chryseobacterium sp. FH2]|uniref:VOC family protein n=1 Tax=Chryseobacterium sp. FH2 TaxID=1674291 RepID=UPI00065ADD02|nr:VOC family protein [Chryseobacterium sp. FH2]KMQ65306.1 phage portal protein [Chryseobacterium sp. FH2]
MIDFKHLDHILITIPPGAIEAARIFYGQVLVLKEIQGSHPKGAIWFEIGNIQLHLREKTAHQTNSDRHPAFVVNDFAAAKKFLEQQQISISYSSEIEGRQRCFFRDPFGNRFELISYKNKAL